MRLLPLLLGAALLAGHEATAQGTLYLDVQVGLHHGYAEEAYLHRGRLAAPVRGNSADRTLAPNLVAASVRLHLSDAWAASAGVSVGNTTGWGYRLTVPAAATNNPFGGESKGYYYSLGTCRLPLLAYRRVWRAATAGVGAKGQTHAWGVGADVQAGLEPSYILDRPDFPRLNIGGLYDTINFNQAPVLKRRFGLGLVLGTTLRLYRLDRERLSLSLQLNQGLWDTVVVPFAYSYNQRGGTDRLHVRGSGITLTLGYPIRLRNNEQQ